MFFAPRMYLNRRSADWLYGDAQPIYRGNSDISVGGFTSHKLYNGSNQRCMPNKPSLIMCQPQAIICVGV